MKARRPPTRRRSGGRHPFDPSRRDFLLGVAATTGAIGLGACGGGGSDDDFFGPGPGPGPTPSTLPPPEESGIDHIVQIMMENRSFDHMLGWVPGADGIQNQTFQDRNGANVATFHMCHG